MAIELGGLLIIEEREEEHIMKKEEEITVKKKGKEPIKEKEVIMKEKEEKPRRRLSSKKKGKEPIKEEEEVTMKEKEEKPRRRLSNKKQRTWIPRKIQKNTENKLSKLRLKLLELQDKLRKQKLLSQQLEARWEEEKMTKLSLQNRKVILGETSNGRSNEEEDSEGTITDGSKDDSGHFKIVYTKKKKFNKPLNLDFVPHEYRDDYRTALLRGLQLLPLKFIRKKTRM
jgi:hypothetical protein